MGAFLGPGLTAKTVGILNGEDVRSEEFHVGDEEYIHDPRFYLIDARKRGDVVKFTAQATLDGDFIARGDPISQNFLRTMVMT